MKTITLRIKKDYALKLIRDLEKSDAVSVVNKKSEVKIRKQKAKKDDDFFLTAGLWKNRNITLKTIRSKAFPVRK